MEESSTSDSESKILETLRSRGWCLGDIDQLKAIIMIHSALADDASTVVDSVESELTNMDLKSIGAKSLPDPTLPRKPSHILGPKVLQISSVRDITKSLIESFSGGSSSRRLLRLGLTDGHNEIIAVEFSHVPSIPDDVVPGTKVRLENKAVVRNGILCLNPKVLTLLGGVVQPLYEEWQMNQKYSGFSRSSLKLSQESGTGGPPPFEKLQIGAPSHRFAQQRKSSDYAGSTSKSSGPNAVVGNTNIRPTGRQQNLDKATSADNNPTGRQQNHDKATSADNNPKTASITEKTENPSSSEIRAKEVVEFVPVQNQAAAQKLRQKMSHQNQDGRHSRGRKYRGKEREEERVVFTLDEWERRNGERKPVTKDGFPNLSRDEDLARQLQNQWDLEDSHVQRGRQEAGADDLRLSMFNYARDDDRSYDRGQGGRGRGRGGRGRGRGRGR